MGFHMQDFLHQGCARLQKHSHWDLCNDSLPHSQSRISEQHKISVQWCFLKWPSTKLTSDNVQTQSICNTTIVARTALTCLLPASTEDHKKQSVKEAWILGLQIWNIISLSYDAKYAAQAWLLLQRLWPKVISPRTSGRLNVSRLNSYWQLVTVKVTLRSNDCAVPHDKTKKTQFEI